MNRIYIIPSILCVAILFACDKDWLTAKRDLNAVVPTNLADMRAILNNSTGPVMAHDYAGMIQVSAGEAVVTDQVFDMGAESERSLYTWNRTIYDHTIQPISEWDDSYRQVFNANVVLEGMALIERTQANATEWDDVRGGALFFRAKAFYNLARTFAPPYRPLSADPGIPLRLVTDPHVRTVRSTVQETYDRILTDLKAAVPLLRLQPKLKTDASRPAAYALLARCLLDMREYDQAGRYADSALQLFPALIDYRTLNPPANQTYPFEPMNAETILYSLLTPLSIFDINALQVVDSELYELYEDGDLRKKLFYQETGGFRGQYSGSALLFGGLAADEQYLIKAECQARHGKAVDALQTLNSLLEMRYHADHYVPATVENTPDVLNLILQERRKELAFRGLRWNDLRRLNAEPGRETTLKRVAKGVTYELQPNDPRYTLPIPPYVIEMTGISQNQR